MYKVVIFDFFGVFCAPIATNWFKKAVPDYQAKLSAFQALCTRSDLGQLSRSGFNQEISKLTGIPVAEVVPGIEAEAAIDTALVNYTANLKKTGLRVACLSNGSHEWTLQVINDHGLRHLFEAIILSGDLGVVKPDAKIYVQALEKLGVQPSEAIFVDDRQANVDAAAALGIRSLVFTDTPTFMKDFEKVTGGDT
ncbi:MAG TPA: HAD-IA family hydrolase [Candidatus Saccharimonadales bacterium]|nr:HAD-IA family hydrolase [Candidatus Saccharimonadales bacterium]